VQVVGIFVGRARNWGKTNPDTKPGCFRVEGFMSGEVAVVVMLFPPVIWEDDFSINYAPGLCNFISK